MESIFFYLLITLYILFLVYTVARILLDTQSTPKTLAYLLLVIVVPILGILIYFSFGINYRHRASRSRGWLAQKDLDRVYLQYYPNPRPETQRRHQQDIGHFSELADFLEQIGGEYLFEGQARLLQNGEVKYPELLAALEKAEHHIHLEYYAWEKDQIGEMLKDVLIRMAGKGVRVRVLFDDYASRGIKGSYIKEMAAAGIAVYPQIRIRFHQLANRLNHRDHRKVVVIDGHTAFVGGINISARYDNSIDTGLYWRDTHVRLDGPLAHGLQRHFIISWNASTETDQIHFGPQYFPVKEAPEIDEKSLVGQIVAGGPIYPTSNIMLSYLRAFTLAREKLYVVNPYFIPSESIMNALKQAAFSGVDVRLILPGKSDSALVSAASRFYFRSLISTGVRIFLYQKGFVHAKTLVADGMLSLVGTANLDIRSFDLNFEIMAALYSRKLGASMEEQFFRDLEDCREVTQEEVEATQTWRLLIYAVARLVSAFL